MLAVVVLLVLTHLLREGLDAGEGGIRRAAATTGGLGSSMLKKRLSMVLDFEVEVEELTEEWLHAHYRRFKSYPEILANGGWADITRQVRLQGALLADEQVLRHYLTYAATAEVDGSERSELAEVFGVGGEDPEAEIFEPLFSRLSEEDALYYRQECAEGRFYDAIEELSTSVRAAWVGARVEEVQTVAVGQTGGAESDKNLMLWLSRTFGAI